MKDEFVRMSLRLQAAFGLRREEAIKLSPSYADHGHEIHLKASWTKGGKPRVIPIRTKEQRQVLNQARALAGKGSLIPSNRNYIMQLRINDRHIANAGLSKMHGLRHAYAQSRYEELTGWRSPAAGEPTSHDLSAKKKPIDRSSRRQISRELGHEREAVTMTYLGR